MIFEKQCRCCQAVKPISEFYEHSTGKDGYRNECKACVQEKAKARNKVKQEIAKAQKAMLNANKTTKVCSLCKVDKPFDMFYKKSSNACGLDSWCKDCSSARSSEYRKQDPDRNKKRCREWYYKNKDSGYAERQLAYRESRKHLRKEYAEQYYVANKELVNSKGRENYRKNLTKYRKMNKVWRDSNRAVCNALSMKYHAQKLNATPSWLTNEHLSEIEDFYVIAKVFQLYTGNEYHVDHIVPLQGKTVCGLHVPWNMQLLTRAENSSKQNRYWPDMPEPE